jgi:ATP-binding cassette subfamily B protein
MRVYEDAAVLSRTSLAAVNIGQGFIIAIGLVLIMGLAGRDIASGHLSIGDFVAVNTYLIQLYLPLNFLGFVYREIRQSLIDIEQMFTLMRENKDITDKDNAGPLQLGKGDVEFRNVVFGYGNRTILNGISFFVPAGRKVAIVGESGAGKSTLSRLLFRFYDPQEGSILIDGQDIRDVQQSSVRAAIGVVPQDTVMFNATIGYNIAYGRQGASETDVREAARLAAIESFIDSLPNGFDERVGERGLKLSGGEKQRVAIARAILKQPHIFLFDEATSALDTRTERGIQEALNDVSRSSTTLVIAHRLSTIVDADEILVMAKGEIVERGTHEALLLKKGLYSVMWQRQSRRPDTEPPMSPLTEGSEADVA